MEEEIIQLEYNITQVTLMLESIGKFLKDVRHKDERLFNTVNKYRGKYMKQYMNLQERYKKLKQETNND